MQFHSKLISILKDPSSWAGFAGILTTFALQLQDSIAIIFHSFAAISGVIAIALKNPES